ncbi:hypothetical protein MED121_09880 [Marinomonas sp. MED121]|nr:hypothetical protein MED121_09880 [Marinomonas sp. MED121]
MYRSGLPDLCWSPDCFNYAFELFKVPLAILALIFPAVALVASHHRSVQTAAQIEKAESQIVLTEAKNNFENYYKHQEYFHEYINNIKNRQTVEFEFFNIYGLYKKIHPKNNINKFETFVIDDGVLKQVSFFVFRFEKLLSEDSFDEINSMECYSNIYHIFNLLNINKIRVFSDSCWLEFITNEGLSVKNESEIDNFIIVMRNYIVIILNEIISFFSPDDVYITDLSSGFSTAYITWSKEQIIKQRLLEVEKENS